MRKLILLSLSALLLGLTAGAAVAQQKGGISARKDVVKDIKAPPATVKAFLDCTNATPVVLDASYSGDTTGGVNNVSAYGCSTWDESGPEAVFVLNLTGPTMFHVDLTSVADLDLVALDSCDEDLGCIVVADTGILTNSPVTGTFYFVVDGYAGNEGAFTLDFVQDPLPIPVDACAEVIQPLPGNEGDVVPPGTYAFSGDTCASTNHLEYLACADYTEAGLDEFFEFTLQPGASIDVMVTSTADGALWIVDACMEPFGCLAYADASLTGSPETISYINTGSTQKTVFLVVDSWGDSSCGTFTVSITINGGVVAVDLPSWGALKTRF